jgi:uncharacterized protein (DUF2062 family)
MILGPPGLAKGHTAKGEARGPWAWARRMVRKTLRHFRAQVQLLRREHTSPARIGVAVGVGVMLGCSPLVGVQVLLALLLARLFGLNRIAIVLGVQISIPPLTPVILFATAQVGARLVRGHWLPLRLAGFKGLPAAKLVADLFLDMAVGGLVLGAFLALVLGTAIATGLAKLKSNRALLARCPDPVPGPL